MVDFRDISLAFDDIIDTPAKRRRQVEEASQQIRNRYDQSGHPFSVLAGGIAGSIPGITENFRRAARDMGGDAFQTGGERIAASLGQIDTTKPAGEQQAIQLLRNSNQPALANRAAMMVAQNERIRNQQARDQIIKASDIYQGKLITRDADNNITSINISGDDYIEPGLRNAELGRISGRAATVRKNAAEIVDAFAKFSGLEAAMRLGNRSAINGAIMQTARLISPGVVTEADARLIAGTPTTTAAVLDFLAGKGVDMTTVASIFDPSNPETFDADQLVATAYAVTAANIPNIQTIWKDEQAAANAYNAPSAYMKATFGIGEDQEMGIFQELKAITNKIEGNAATKINMFDTEAAATNFINSEDYTPGTTLRFRDPADPNKYIEIKGE